VRGRTRIPRTTIRILFSPFDSNRRRGSDRWRRYSSESLSPRLGGNPLRIAEFLRCSLVLLLRFVSSLAVRHEDVSPSHCLFLLPDLLFFLIRSRPSPESEPRESPASSGDIFTGMELCSPNAFLRSMLTCSLSPPTRQSALCS